MGKTRNETVKALEAKYQFYRRMTFALALVCVFLLVVTVGQWTMNAGSATTPDTSLASQTSTPSADAAEPSIEAASAAATIESAVVRRDASDTMAIGDIDAPVVLVEWTDLRCPFCAAFHRDTLPTIVSEYVDAGLVRIEVHDVAFFGEQSTDGAVAARAAGNQGMFFDYTQLLYANAPESGHPDLTREVLLTYAREVGIPDMDRFTADLDDPALREAVRTSTSTAQQLGITSVPFFVAGDTAVAGSRPVEVFRQFLDDALEQAQ
ncbi:MAG: DsbA family protein [Beutenbergiaceae bacterium]